MVTLAGCVSTAVGTRTIAAANAMAIPEWCERGMACL
jgi:hypothetical protein